VTEIGESGWESAERHVESWRRASLDGWVNNYRSPVLTAAVVVPLAVCALLSPFRNSFDNANAALLLVLVIVAVASFGIRPAGVVAAVSSAVWFDLFLTVPYYRLTIANRDDIENTVLLVVIGAAVTEIAIWGRRQQARASRQSGYLAGVLTASRRVAAGGSAAELLDHVRAELIDLLGLDGCRFAPTTTGRANAPLLNHDGSVTRGSHELRVERDGLPTNAEVELVVQHAGFVRGRFLLTAAARITRPDLEQRRVAVALANQVGAALSSNNAEPVEACPPRP
jgi:K+-sensing histidine kinase KdpD